MGKDWKKHKYIRKEGSRYIYKDTKNKRDYRDEAELLNNVLSDMDQRTLVRETGRYLKNKVTRGKDGITRPTKVGDAMYDGLTKITDAENNNKLKKKWIPGLKKYNPLETKQYTKQSKTR